MRTSGRRSAAAIVLVTAVGLALAGCARAAGPDALDGTNTTTFSDEGQALVSMGFAPADVLPGATELALTSDSTPSPTRSTAPGRGALRRFARLRLAFGGRLLHGEATVQTPSGPKTIVVQRGTVTAVDATTVTVKSADGFVLTWSIGDPVRVVINRTKSQASAVAVGAVVGVAGVREGDKAIARLIVEPKK